MLVASIAPWRLVVKPFAAVLCLLGLFAALAGCRLEKNGEGVTQSLGRDHIGVGGDYDGCPEFPVELPDVSSYPALFGALADRGWSDDELVKLAGGNILRVLRAADDIAG